MTATAPAAPTVRSRGGWRRLVATTPRRYRVASLVASLVLVVMIAAGTVATVNAVDATSRLRRNTGPVLVATQSLVASLAEADAAATAAFLSGAGAQEDRDQRNLYEDALARAARRLEQVSSLIGADPRAHDRLGDLGVSLTRYAGLVEAARAENRSGNAEAAAATLVRAVDLLSRTIAGDAAALTASGQARFAAETAHRSRGIPLAGAAALLALLVLVAAQLDLVGRSRRLVNVPLVLATIAVVVTLAFIAAADQRAGDDLAVARADGYRSIELTARIQTEGSAAKSAETLALITGDPSSRAAADRASTALAAGPMTRDGVEAARAGFPPDTGLLGQAVEAADSARERAAVSEMLVWWDRYRTAVEELREAADQATAVALATGDVSSAFSGFNISVESVLGDNQAQFAAALESAAGRYDGLGVVVFVGGALAIALVLAGYQLRINEYR